jgi:hypothetical protein
MGAEDLLEMGQYFAEGYKPVLDFEGWRVAMLRYGEFVNVKTLHQVERHRETNEVFILTAGEADLILCSGGAVPDNVHILPMQQNVAYNIPVDGWHHVIMRQDAHIILFEKTNTSKENTDYAELTQAQLKQIKQSLRPLGG